MTLTFARRHVSRGTRAMTKYRTPLSIAKGKRRGGSTAPRPGKKARVATRTMSKTKRLNQGVHESRAGSDSKFFLSYKPTRIGKLTGKMAKVARTINQNTIYSGGAGVQRVIDVDACFDVTTSTNLMNQCILQQYGTSTPVGYKTERILYKSCLAEYAYTNSTNAVCRMLLFDIVPRTDIYNTSGDANSPVNAWSDGFSDEISGGTGGQAQIVGAMPFASVKFCHFFKVLKITNINLAPGQMHVHRVKHTPNKIINNEVLSQGNVSSLRGLTLHHMGVFYGQPVLDAGGGVTTEATKILCIRKFSYEVSYLPNNMTSLVMNNNLSATAGANIEDMVTGAAAAFAAV